MGDLPRGTNTEVPKHKGISFFILDLSLPGVEIRPIRQAAGSAEFNEIFLTDVMLPADCRIGEENDGWRLAQTTLSTERATQIVELHAQLAIASEQICAEAAATAIGNGRMASDHEGIREDLARLVAQVDVLGFMAKDMVAGVVTHGDVGPEGSVVKVFYSETLQALTGLAARIRGMRAQTPATRIFNISYTTGNWMLDHMESWTWTIAAGANEIQRNIIGERILGLPREPKTA